MNIATHDSVQQVTAAITRSAPTRAAMERALGVSMTQSPSESRPELQCRILLADGSGGATCTYLPFADRPVVHLKLDQPVNPAAWHETVRALGHPDLHVPRAPWTAPGVRGRVSYTDLVYRVDESTELHLRRRSGADDVTDVLVIWRL
jgi:hypothetical protein